MKNRTTYHHKNLKEKLILKALELLDNKPYESITVRELTDSLGVSRTAIYRHFSSKEHLFQAVILKGFEQLGEAMEPIYQDSTTDTKGKFYKIGEVYVDFALASPPRYRLMMGDKLMKIREESCEVEKEPLADGAFGIMLSLVKQAQEEGLFKRQNSLHQAIAIWSLIHGQASLLLDGHPMVKETRNETQKIMFEMMTGGLSRSY